MYSFFRELLSNEQPIMEKFAVLDPTAVGNQIRNITLTYTPLTDQSPTSVVSLCWTDSKKKLYEKQFEDDSQAQSLYGTMRRDLSEAADLTKKEKTSAALSLVNSLLKRYAVYTEELATAEIPPVTNTMAQKKKIKADELDDIDKSVESPENVGSPEWIDGVLKQYEEENSRIGYVADEDDIMNHLLYVANEEGMGFNITENTLNQWLKEWAVWKSQQKRSSVGKIAKVVMQNLFFETPDELMAYQEKMKSKQPTEKALGDFKDDLPEMGIPESEEIAPSSLSHEDYEKQQAEEAKSLTKRIEHEVKEQVESALDNKIASTFDKVDDDLIRALRQKGRTWEEIKEYYTKNLKYDKDSVAAYTDALRQAEGEPLSPHSPKQDLVPSAPKPPDTLVSPETHDKLIKEIEEPKKEELVKEIENQFVSAQEISIQDTEIQKVAEEPLETIPKQRMNQNNDMVPKFTDVADEMKDIETPLSEDLGDPVEFEEPINVGDPVYVMGNYETTEAGYEGKLAGKFTTDGEDYAVIDAGHSELREVPMRFVKKAIFGKYYREIKARKAWLENEFKETEKTEVEFAKKELNNITSELKDLKAVIEKEAAFESIVAKISKTAIAFQRGNAYVIKWLDELDLDSDKRVATITRSNISPEQKYSEVEKLIPEILANLPEDRIQIKQVDWDKPEINSLQLQKFMDSEQEMWEIEMEEKGLKPGEAAKIESGVTKIAEPPTIAPSKDPRVPMEPVPTTYKELKISPKDTEERQKEMADIGFQTVLNGYKETKEKIDNVNRMVEAIKAHLQTRIRTVEERGRKSDLLLQAQQKIEQVASLVEKAKDKVILAGNELYTLREGIKKEPYKVSPKEMLEKVIAKYDLKKLGVDKFLEQVENGAHALDEEIKTRELIKSPYPHKTMSLSKLDKEAGIMDTLDFLFESISSLVNALPGGEELQPEPAAKIEDKLEK